MVTLKPGETHHHSEHGDVRIEEICRGIAEYDSETGSAVNSDRIIVSFSTYWDEYGALNEQTEEIDEFLDGLNTK
jgi:hypothetical protein